MSAAIDQAATVQALANNFTNALKEWLSEDEFAAMCANNANETDPAICHSHDYCDANMAMDDAFTVLRGFGPLESAPDVAVDEMTQADIDLWNAAWNAAKASWQNV